MFGNIYTLQLPVLFWRLLNTLAKANLGVEVNPLRRHFKGLKLTVLNETTHLPPRKKERRSDDSQPLETCYFFGF